METQKCPHCGASVKKENLRGHYERIHPRKIDSLIRAKKEPVPKARLVFRNHRKRNILAVSVIMLAVVGVYFLLLTGLPTVGLPTPGTYPGPAAAGTMAEF